MQLNKKIIFRYQNFKNKYIKNKSQIGKGDNNPNFDDFDILNTNVEKEKKKDTDLLGEFNMEIINDYTEINSYKDNNMQNRIYNLKILSKLKNGTFPKTQFPLRMISCEDAIHDLASIGANLLQTLPKKFINNKIKELGEPSSFDAIIKIENLINNSNYYDGDFETIQKKNHISDHDGIVLKLNEKKNTSSIKPKYINIISFNLEGLCRQNFTKNDELYIDPTFAQRLELLDIHLRKYIDRNQSFILVCQEIVLQNRVNNENHLYFLNDSCFKILEKLQEIRGQIDIIMKNDEYTSGIFYSNDISIDKKIKIERYEKKKSDDKTNDSSKGSSSISSSSSSFKTNIIPLRKKISNVVIRNKQNEITEEKLKDTVSSSSNNNQLKKKSNAYLINNDFWIVNIHLKASASKNQHIKELTNIIDRVFIENKNIFKNVYLIGDFNHNNIETNTIENLVKSAINESKILKTEQIENQ
jgi:hypothetical protein